MARTPRNWSTLLLSQQGRPALVRSAYLASLAKCWIGKSALGDHLATFFMNSESCPLAWQHGAVTRLAIAFSLGNGTDIGSAVAHTRSAATLLTARILRSALLSSSDDADILGCLPAVNIQTPKAALEVVRQATIEASGSTTLACMLVIDEVQRLSEWNLLRDFIVTLGGVQLEFPRPSPTDGGIFLSCIVLGTAYGAITEIISTSAFPLCALSLPLLAPSDSCALMERVFGNLAWPKLQVFEHALLLCGGWPRVLQFFVDEVRSWKKDPIFPAVDFSPEDLHDFVPALTEHLVAFYPRWGKAVHREVYLLAAAFLGLELDPDATLVGDNLTLRNASETGLCIIVPGKKDPRRYVVKLPALITAKWARSAKKNCNPAEREAFRHIARLPKVRHWVDFEVFIATEMMARITLYGPLGANVSELTLRDLLRTAEAPKESFAVPPCCQLVDAKHRWPNRADDEALPPGSLDGAHVVRLADSSRAVDVLVPLRLKNGGGLYYLCLQLKHTRADAPLTVTTIQETEAQLCDAISAMRGERVAQLPDNFLLVFVTNRDTAMTAGTQLPARTLVLHTHEFLGTTAARLLDINRSAAPAPNTSPRRKSERKKRAPVFPWSPESAGKRLRPTEDQGMVFSLTTPT